MGPVWEETTGRHLIRPCRLLSVSPQKEPPCLDHSRPRTKASESAGVPMAPRQPVAYTGYLGAGGGGCLAGDSQSAWTPHTKYLRGQDQPPLPRMGSGLGVTPALPYPNEMSATKDGTQRGLSRNKGQVLAWEEGRGRAGQLITCNNCSGHPQAVGQLAPGTGSLYHGTHSR